MPFPQIGNNLQRARLVSLVAYRPYVGVGWVNKAWPFWSYGFCEDEDEGENSNVDGGVSGDINNDKKYFNFTLKRCKDNEKDTPVVPHRFLLQHLVNCISTRKPTKRLRWRFDDLQTPHWITSQSLQSPTRQLWILCHANPKWCQKSMIRRRAKWLWATKLRKRY